MFKKSATELKLNPKLLGFENIFNLVTFNVRTLDTVNQLPDLTASAAEHMIDIICRQKHRYYHSELDMKY